MRKFIIAVLVLVMLLAVAVSAGAENTVAKEFTINNVPCEKINDSELYRYRGQAFVAKTNGNNAIKIKHYVMQIDADETNRIAAYRQDTGKTMGASWKPADNTYYLTTSNAIVSGQNFASHSATDIEKACDVVYEMEDGELTLCSKKA